jgi:hypothetical protein
VKCALEISVDTAGSRILMHGLAIFRRVGGCHWMFSFHPCLACNITPGIEPIFQWQ